MARGDDKIWQKEGSSVWTKLSRKEKHSFCRQTQDRPISILLVTFNMCGGQKREKNERNEPPANFLMSPSLEQTQLLLALSTLRTHTAGGDGLANIFGRRQGLDGKYLVNRRPTFALGKYCCDTEPTTLFIQRSFEISFSHSPAKCFLLRKV